MRLLVSFSGGETSAYMLAWVLENYRQRYSDIRCVFANTGQEREETLVFVDRVSKLLGIDTVWVEAVVHPGERKAPTHRIVNFDSASRDGRPFEDHIAKYGLPNAKFKDCTRGLKRRPIESYLRAVGWEPGTYDTAIGIRADEVDRISSESKQRRLVYPLISENPTTKPDVNAYWTQQPFRLGLKGYQGNCKWCWKKSLRKHFTLILEDASSYDFPRRMEKRYGLLGPEFRKEPPPPAGYRRVFFRGNVSTDKLFQLCALRSDDFQPAADDADFNGQASSDLDVGAGCEDGCEIYADEDELPLPEAA